MYLVDDATFSTYGDFGLTSVWIDGCHRNNFIIISDTNVVVFVGYVISYRLPMSLSTVQDAS